MKRKLISIFIFALVFVYCANIHFVFLPALLRTKLIIGVIGIVYVFFSYLHRFPKNNITPLLYTIIPLFVWMSLSVLLNSSGDYWFLQFSLVQIAYICGAWMIVDICGINSVSKLAKLLVLYVLVQNTVAFLGLQIPSIRTFIEVTTYDDVMETQVGRLTYRGLGFGDHVFFGGGIWSCLGLLMLVYLYNVKDLSKTLFAILYVYVFFTGLFVARTSMVGIITLLLLFTPFKKNWYKVVGVSLMTISLFVLMGSIENWMLQRGYVVGNAFELYENYMSTGEISTSSSESTISMMSRAPSTLETWVLGDARYTDKSGGYYMHTDVGYLRVIWYGGIIGLILYLYQIFRFCYLIYQKERTISTKYLFLMYYLMTLIFMLKGHADTSCVLYLFFSAVCIGINNRNNILTKSLYNRSLYKIKNDNK